jgi:hypothetical protein
MQILLFAFLGDCGTPYPHWWGRHPPPPPWWFVVDLLAAVGGIAGGVIAQRLGPQPEPWLPYLAAFVVGRVIGSLSARVLSGVGAKAAAPQLANQAA